MRFVTSRKLRDEDLSAGLEFIFLEKEAWDDFGFRTTFSLSHYSSNAVVSHLGRSKFLRGREQNTSLPDRFSRLEGRYCSLGQTEEFYKAFAKVLGPQQANAALECLRDIRHDATFADPFLSTSGLENSLLRYSAASKMFDEARRAQDLAPRAFGPSLIFETQLPGFATPHMVRLNFEFENNPLKRVFAFTGNSATGKSRTLAHLATTISGEGRAAGRFLGPRPEVRKTIVIAYSLFQPFKSTVANADTYVFCGSTIGQDGRVANSVNAARFLKAFKQLVKNDRFGAWLDVWADVNPDTSLADADQLNAAELLAAISVMSSGHRLYLQILQDILVNIEPHSLVIIDEPELHLHPAMVSGLMRRLHRILETNSSVAIVATHSPVVLQEVPSSNVRIFTRDGDVPSVQVPGLETFGATLSEIAEIGFRMGKRDRNYFSRLQDLNRTDSIDSIREMFGDRVSLSLGLALDRLGTKK